MDLTSTEKEVLRFLCDEHLTIRKIAIRRGVSRQAIEKVVKRLKIKGVIGLSNNKVAYSESTTQHLGRFRLHGLEFCIRILHKGRGYDKLLSKSNVVYLDGNTVKLSRFSLELYVKRSFFGNSVKGVTRDSVSYLDRFLVRLENEFKVLLVKPRSRNIRRVAAHYAQWNNGLARYVDAKGGDFRFFARDDGKLWFLSDKSLNLHEGETVHPVTSEDDMSEVVEPFMNDLRDRKSPLPSEVWAILGRIAKHEEEIGAGLSVLVSYLNPKKEVGGGKLRLPPPEYVG